MIRSKGSRRKITLLYKTAEEVWGGARVLAQTRKRFKRDGSAQPPTTNLKTTRATQRRCPTFGLMEETFLERDHIK